MGGLRLQKTLYYVREGAWYKEKGVGFGFGRKGQTIETKMLTWPLLSHLIRENNGTDLLRVAGWTGEMRLSMGGS